eukprot:Phypoly_transcript_00265.p1 GENE.Phypoly_transcript_00265~~Phypoly_transcript_00265.p1  ORF type:complete len:1816 (+),score=381.18 Phypoly_transcript_00265:125-5572(+)
MQTRSSARNTKKNEVVTTRPSRRNSKDPLPKVAKKNEVASPPEEPSSPGSPHGPSPQSQTSTSSEENGVENENQNEEEISNVNNSDLASKPASATNNTSTTSTSSKATNPLSRSMTLRSSLGARPKKRIWSPESFRRERWSDEVKFHRFTSKKGPRKQIRAYASDDSSSESSEIDRHFSRTRSRKGDRRLSRLFDSSDESLEDDDESDSDEDSDDVSDDDSYDSEELRSRKRKLRSKGHKKRKIARQGVKSDTEGAEALMGLADSVLLMDEEPRRSKTPQRSTPEPRPRKHRPQPQPREDRARDPGFDIRNFLVPPPVFPKTAIGSAPTPGSAQQQPIWKRGALHAAIAYYVFYQQRYDLLQQLSVPNAQYAQKFLLALSLDPTSEAKMLRARAEAARQQLMQSKGQDSQSKSTPEQPVLLSPSPFSLYPNASPASGYLQPQARTQKPVPILLSPPTPHPSGSTSSMKPEASSISTLDSLNSTPQLQKAPVNAPASSSTSALQTPLPLTTTPRAVDSTSSFAAASSTVDGLNTPQAPVAASTPVGRMEPSQDAIQLSNMSPVGENPTLPLSTIVPSSRPTSSQDQLTEAVVSTPSSNPSTPTTQSTSLEVDLAQTSTQETQPRPQEMETSNGFEPTFLNFEDEPNSEHPGPPNDNPQSSQPSEVLESLSKISENQIKKETQEGTASTLATATIDSNPFPSSSADSIASSSLGSTEVARIELDSQPTQKATPAQESQEAAVSTTAQPAPAHCNQTTSSTTTTSTTGASEIKLESADWNSFELGATFRKGRMSAYTPAQVMVSPFNYLMSPTEPSRPFEYNNKSEIEDINKNAFYAEQQRQHYARFQQRQPFMPKPPYAHPYPVPPNFYGQPQAYNPRMGRNQPYAPHHIRDEGQRNDPNGNRPPGDPYAYYPGFGQPHGPHFPAPEWHHYDPQEQYGPGQMHRPQGPNAPFHVDPRTGSMHRAMPQKAHENPDPKIPDGELWAQHSNTQHKHAQLFHSQPILPTQQPEQPHGSLNSLQEQQAQAGTQMHLSQQQQISARHSTENLANLKRQIRSKALAARGAGFGGSFRRTPHVQQLQQGNLQGPGAYQLSGHPADQPRYIVINDDTDGQKPAQPSSSVDNPPDQALDLTAPDGDEKGKEETLKDQEQERAPDFSQQTQVQLQQQLQQQQLRMLQQQKEQAALLEYQKQMHQRALLAGPNPPAQIPSDSPASITLQPTIAPESVPSYLGNQHSYQRLQQLHFQFKQQQRLQQLQKQPQSAAQLSTSQQSNADRTPQTSPAAVQPSRKQTPPQQYLVQYTQYQHYPSHTSHVQLHQGQPAPQPTNATAHPQISHPSQGLQPTNPTSHPQGPQPQPVPPSNTAAQAPTSQSQQVAQPTNATSHPQTSHQQTHPQAQQPQQTQMSQQPAQPPAHPQPQPQVSQPVQSYPQPQQQNPHQIPHATHSHQSHQSAQPQSQQMAHPHHPSQPHARPQHPQSSHLLQQQPMPQNLQQLQLAHLQKLHARDQKLVHMQNTHKLQPQDKLSSTSAEHLEKPSQPQTSQFQEMQTQLQPTQAPHPQPQPPQQPQHQQQHFQKSQPHPSQQPSPQILQAQQYIMQQTTNRVSPTHALTQQIPAQQPGPPRAPAQAQMQQWQYVMPQYPQKVVTNPNQNNMPVNVHYTLNQQKLTPQQQQQIILQQQQQLAQAQVQAQGQAQTHPHAQQTQAHAQAQQTQQSPSGPVLMQFTQVSPSKFRKLPTQTPRPAQPPRSAPTQPSQSAPPPSSHPPQPSSSPSLSSSPSPSLPPSSSPSQNIAQFQHKLQLEPLVRPPKQEHPKPNVPPSAPN